MENVISPGTKRRSITCVVDGFKEIRLALAILPHQDYCASVRLHRSINEITKLVGP